MNGTYNIRAQNVKSKQWFGLTMFDKKQGVDLAKALEQSELWCMVSLTKEVAESIDWRD